MLLRREEVLTVVYRVMDELNEEHASESRLPLSKDTVIFGSDSNLDSLGLVNLIVGVEQKILEELGLEIIIVSDKAMSRKRSPFRTVESLVDYIVELVEQP